jgi:sterol desaturase/sphingolipid hydroxylase (fatty acid hydroxylase superfamily)
VSKLFSKEIWTHPSSLLDMKLFFFNSILKILIITLWVNLIPETTIIFLKTMRSILPEIKPLSTSYAIYIYTLLSFVIDDFSRFFTHYLFHRIKFLWKFHQIHHSATVMTPLTLHRSHPLESVSMFFRNILTHAFTTALFIYFFRSHISALEILGVNALGMMFNFSLSNLRHSHVPISFGRLESIFLSPLQHQIHHSNKPSEHHTNFGICFAFWDSLFKTWKASGPELKSLDYQLPLQLLL